MPSVMRLALIIALTALAQPACADGLRRLETGTDSKGWEAVGRLNLGGKGFCTGALISPNLVLTAAHCLWDRKTGERLDASAIEFLAGWRNGRAAAYRNVRRAVAHPDYVYDGSESMERVQYDLALLELDTPIRLPSIRPYATGGHPQKGDAVGVVSYARDRAEAPSLQEVCHVLGHQPGVMVLSCDVDFGSSGAPVFSMTGGAPQVVSVVAAKAEMTGQKVALGSDMTGTLETLRAALETTPAMRLNGSALPQIGAGGGARKDGAKFLRPAAAP
ncbi:Trypsin [Gemmobacter megaterium]|uniref:Serine protease n=2 Tax=Gemmobacter megaterium TaxID=1086013 RepID=A0A1N7QCX3_9RHOB|nr:serine protease [Gemmobacter megaterium]SIT20715.1 Trypsin [Gemmobacter megaterium]